MNLGDTSMKWYENLAPESTRSWKQMTELFIARFIISNKRLKDIGASLTFKRRVRESLRQYAIRYWEEVNEVEACLEAMTVIIFRLGLS